MKPLRDLDATFVGDYHAGAGNMSDPTTYRQLDSVEGAQGVLFVCPKCGNHSVLCWFSNPRNAPAVPDSASPKPGRWTFRGDTIDQLTLQPSVDLSSVTPDNPASENRCYWHGWVEHGAAR